MKVSSSCLSPRLSVVVAVLLAAGSAGTASAQTPARAPAPFARATTVTTTTTTWKTADYTEQNIQGDQVVKFTGDELAGDVNGAYGTVIRRMPGIVRCPLIRPRVNFVPELLSSVENL